jgi:spermidine/putrescine-binding protein
MQRIVQNSNLRLPALAAMVLAVFFSAMALPATAAANSKRLVTVNNNSSTEVQVRMKLWQRDFTRISAGRTQQFEVPQQYNTVQVEAKSRKQGDNCWSNVQVGGTLAIIDGNQQIVCQPQ